MRCCRWGVVCLLACAAAFAQGEDQRPAVQLKPGAGPLAVEAPAEAVTAYSLLVPAGETANLLVEQTAGTISVLWTDPDRHTHEARANPAGLHSIVRFSSLGPGEHIFRIQGRARTSTAHATLTVTAGSGNQSFDKIAAEEESLAHAEALRVKRNPADKSEALVAYDRAIQLASSMAGAASDSDETTLCQALTLKAMYLLTVANDVRAALPLVRQSTSLTRIADPVELASAWKVAGFIDVSLAHYEEGISAYEHALELFRRSNDLYNQEVLLQNRSSARRLTGDFYGAFSDAQAALPLAAQLQDAARQSGIEESLGSLYYEQGDYQHAYQTYRAGLEASVATPNLSIRGYLWSDLGQLDSDLGDSEAAVEAFRQADAVWKAAPNLPGQLSTLDGYGTVLRSEGKAQLAASRYQEGLELARKAGLQREIAGLLLGLARADLALHKPAAALAAVQEACAIVQEIHEQDSYPEYLLTLADSQAMQGDNEAAVKTYHQALEASSAASNIATSIAAFGALAQIAEKRDRLSEAEQFAEAAISLIETSRQRLTEDALKTSYYASKRSYYDFEIDLLMSAYRRSHEAQYLRRAFLTAEQARARQLLDQLDSASFDVIANAPAELAAQHREAIAKLRAEQNRLAIALGKGRGANVRSEQDKVVAFTRALDDLEGRIREGTARSVQPTPEFQVETLQQSLKPSELALEYWVSETHSYVWAITRTSFHGLLLPAGTVVRHTVEAYLQAVQGPLHAQAAGSAAELAAQLAASQAATAQAGAELKAAIIPVGLRLPPRARVIVVPDGPLFDVPFAALPSGTSGTLLVETNAVIEEPSLRIFSTRKPRATQANPLRVALFADPVYSASDPRVSNLAASPGSPSGVNPAALTPALMERNPLTHTAAAWPRLEASQSEVSNIARAVGSDHASVFTGFDASPESVRAALGERFNILHFAAHTELNRDHPELSGILLSALDRHRNPQDGVLWYSDISKMRLHVQLVVLSTCESSSGRNLPGEGLISLSYAFLIAGTPRVIGTLWKIDDRATSELMSRFYSNLMANGGNVDEALRQAQLSMKKDKNWSNPYYWAGVVFAGDASTVDVR